MEWPYRGASPVSTLGQLQDDATLTENDQVRHVAVTGTDGGGC